MECDSGLMFLKKRILFWVVVCFKIDFNLGLVFLKKIFLFWVLGFVSKWVICGSIFADLGPCMKLMKTVSWLL